MTATVEMHNTDSGTTARIEELLINIGVPATCNGFEYLKNAITTAVTHPEIIRKNYMKGYLSRLSSAYGATTGQVQRNIEYAIGRALSRGSTEDLTEIFGKTYLKFGNVSPKAFIILAADYIRRSNE